MRRSRAGLTVAVAGLLIPMPPTAVLAATTPPEPTPVLPRNAVLPTCAEWQTTTVVPAPTRPGLGASSRSATAPGAPTPAPTTVPGVAVCRNAPPVPFSAPVYLPDDVVGGARLADAGIVVDDTSGVPAPPEVPDVSYVIADYRTGDVLAAKNAHAWLRPASTLKTLTAVTLMPLLRPDQKVVATAEMVSANGTRAGMLLGNPYTVANLFDGLLMLSANDCAYGLADAAGGYDKTLALMNDKAASLGAYDTVAVDPSGLDEPGQRSSAYDLALFGRAALRTAGFSGYATKRDAVFPGGKDASGKVWEPFHLYNINTLLTHYPGANGIKPGRTNRAQHTFIGSATRGGRTLIVAQMGSTTGKWQNTAALLDWGFAHADAVEPVGRLVEPGEAHRPVVAPHLPVAESTTGTGSQTLGPPATTTLATSVPTIPATASATTARDGAGAGAADGSGANPAPWTGDGAVLAVGALTVLGGIGIIVTTARRSRRRRA